MYRLADMSKCILIKEKIKKKYDHKSMFFTMSDNRNNIKIPIRKYILTRANM